MTQRSWSLAAFLMTLWVTVLIAAQWYLLPWFLDYFYHLAVVDGFRQSGGLVLHDWWEFAPVGRPHLYPPLWHLLMLPLASSVPLLVIARFWCVASFPLFAWVLWRSGRRLFNAQEAAWWILLLAAPFSLTVAILNYPTTTLATLFVLGAWVALEKGLWVAASVAVAAAGYTHTGTFLILILTLVFLAVIRKEGRRETLLSLLTGLLLAAPWLIHQVLHLQSVHIVSRRESNFLELSPFLFALAGWGGFRSRRKPEARFCVAWWLGSLPMLIHYPFRFLAGHGLIPTILLAGLGASELWKKGPLWKVGLVALLLLWPVWHKDPGANHWALGDSAAFSLAGAKSNVQRVTNQPLHFEKFWNPVAHIIEKNTAPDELFACNLDYAAGLLSVLSHRATTVGMLGEVAGSRDDPVAAAKVVVLVKSPHFSENSQVKEFIRRHGLSFLAETEIAVLYANPKASGKRKIGKAVMPWWAALAWMGAATAAVLRERRSRSRSPRSL